LELRIGLGCMRLPEETAVETITAAADAGITVFDTARAYEGNEELLAGALRGREARIVTKGGMGAEWVPDGRAKAIRADCEASLAALDGLPIDLYLIHTPDPRTPWKTSVRALARLVDDGLVRRAGVANVNRRQLDEALELAPIAAVQIALSVFDDRAIRGGVLERCEEAGIALIAHTPLGGPRRRVARHEDLARIAAKHGATPAEVALAWLLALSPAVVAIPGARRPEAARSVARAAELDLDADDVAALGGRRPAPRVKPRQDADVVVVMGVPAAGKTRMAEDYVARGYVQLNRDERGGSLRELADALDEALSGGARQVVLDNTYLTRASRSFVVEVAGSHGIQPRCVWLDTPLAQAQVNLVERLLDRFGYLPAIEELGGPELLAPTSQMRAFRELEPPSDDEGFAAVERVEFERAPRAGRPGVFVAAAALDAADWTDPDPSAPHLLFDWRPDGSADDLADRLAGAEAAICPHGGGPPRCWCRPPLPGLPLAFARANGVEASRSILVGTSTAHRTLATTLGAHYVAVY
jgi:aryl-alcohol dehydrogenase-like predicted oxidoreductase